MIKVGDQIPNAMLKQMTDQGIIDVDLHSKILGKKIVLFALPAAFSKTCSVEHLPSYVKLADTIKSKGVDEIICVAVNDPIVMKAWEVASHVDGKITLLSDWDGTFSKLMGLSSNDTQFGLGLRSLRYTSIVENGVLLHIEVETNPGVCTVSKADSILEYI